METTLSNRGQGSSARLVTLAAALVVLDASLAFKNVWPTPAIRWHGALSVELAVCVLAMAIARSRGASLSRRALAWLGAVWVVLIVVRYADVTAPALYGRPVNLFWDMRHVSAVGAMLARVASWWLVLLIISAAVVIPFVLYTLIRWALGTLNAAMSRRTERRVLGALAVVVIVLFSVGRVYNLSGFYDEESFLASAFPAPVTSTIARQARLLVTEVTGRSGAVLGQSPPMDVSLAGVRGADVLLIFIESYGAVELGPRQPRGTGCRRACASRRGHPRDRTRRRVGIRRVADLRGQFVAGPHQPVVGARNPR